uniref:Uncharacterized protein n=1 Tax=Acrobeloides nanus TaxID=290746 RepID=A0A914DP37_9BILA
MVVWLSMMMYDLLLINLIQCLICAKKIGEATGIDESAWYLWQKRVLWVHLNEYWKPMTYEFMDFELLLNEKTLQEGLSEYSRSNSLLYET